MFNRISKFLKLVLPIRIFSILRSIFTAVLTPIFFSYKSGHFYSSLLMKSVDKNFKAIPWYTYPAIDYLASLDIKNKKVLEFGSGQSSYWWAERTQQVCSLEDSDFFFQKLNRNKPSNLKLFMCDTHLKHIGNAELSAGYFDIIVIDGFDRYQCFLNSLELISEDGIFIFDNSEGYHEHVDSLGKYPILKLMHNNSYKRMDYYGYAPGVIKKHCTSIFYKENSFINKLNLRIVRF
jgi:hypothetical protein